jgi:hypothetical protein
MKLSIANRLYLGFALVVGIGVASMMLALSQSARVGATVDHVLTEDLATVHAAELAALHVAKASTAAAKFVDVPKDAAAQDVLGNLATAREHLQQITKRESDGPSIEAAKQAETELGETKAAFEALVEAYRVKGFTENDGATGKLRAAVHAVEKAVNELKQKDLSILMLMCRRHEKDFMLRGDAKYLDQTNTRVGEFKAAAAKLEIPAETLAGLTKQMDEYATGMTAFVAAQKKIEQINTTYMAAAERVTATTKALAE